MRSALGPGDVAVDAGAYKGGYTYWMRQEVGDSGRIFAFEPQPELAAFVRRMVGAFGWSNVHVEEAALSAESGERTLHAPGPRPTQDASLVGALSAQGTRRYTVSAQGLDAFLEASGFEGRVGLIKCDVEGHELDVFRGAEHVLRNDRPLLLFECEARHDPARPVSAVFRYLEALGYEGSFFWKGALVDVRQFDVEMHQKLGRKPYANNFVFEKRGT